MEYKELKNIRDAVVGFAELGLAYTSYFITTELIDFVARSRFEDSSLEKGVGFVALGLTLPTAMAGAIVLIKGIRDIYHSMKE